MNTTENKHFHGYATANDDRLYFRDIQNLFRIKKTSSGVEKVELYIAISKVRKIGAIDRIFVWAVKQFFHRHPSIVLKKIFFKTNVGRDFSSYSLMADLIVKEARSNDYIFFQNRSGYGPFRNRWLREMILQYEKFDKTAICGSTINFKDHPNRSSKNLPHVQTYAFLIRNSYLKMLNGDFPGHEEISRINIILEGEIGLSQFFIQKGYGITCMEWPEYYISNKSEPLYNDDIKSNVSQDHQFYHRNFGNRSEKFLEKPLKKIYLFCSLLIQSSLIFINRSILTRTNER